MTRVPFANRQLCAAVPPNPPHHVHGAAGQARQTEHSGVTTPNEVVPRQGCPHVPKRKKLNTTEGRPSELQRSQQVSQEACVDLHFRFCQLAPRWPRSKRLSSPAALQQRRGRASPSDRARSAARRSPPPAARKCTDNTHTHTCRHRQHTHDREVREDRYRAIVSLDGPPGRSWRLTKQTGFSD